MLGAVGGGANLAGVAVGPAVAAARALQELAADSGVSTLVADSTRVRLSDSSREVLREFAASETGGPDARPAFELIETLSEAE